MQAATGIPDIEKRVVVASLLFAGAMLALIGYAAVRLGISVPGCVTNVKPFDSGELIQVAPGRYEAHVVHGFYMDGTDVNLTAIPNAVNYAQARFDKPGKFQIICHEFCGSGHHDMVGFLEVTP